MSHIAYRNPSLPRRESQILVGACNCYVVEDVHNDRLITCKINIYVFMYLCMYVCMYVCMYDVSPNQMSHANAQYFISYRH